MMEILVHLPWWVWLLLSIVPYSIKRQRASNMQSLVLSALFWQFSFKHQKKQYSWSFSLPWIKHMQRNRSLRKLIASSWVKLIQEGAKKVISCWR
jgi:hypothetical protein